MKKIIILSIICFGLIGCAKEYSTFENNVYKNSLYGFEFTLPEGGELTGDEAVPLKENTEGSDPIYQVSFYLGYLKGDVNTMISVYSKDDVSDSLEYILEGAEEFKVAKLDNNVEVWSGIIDHRGEYIFVRTIYIGEKYVYYMDSSSNEKLDIVVNEHNGVANTFKVEKGY